MTANDTTQPAGRSPLGVYQDHLAEGRLAYQFDPVTAQPVFYPRLLGPSTGSQDLQWRISCGTGTVYATTVVHQRGEPPYNVSLVDLDEGFRMMTRVQTADRRPVRIGMRVVMRVFEPADGSAPYPIFESIS